MAHKKGIEVKTYSSYYTFITENKLEEWFKKKYKIYLDDWDNDISDEEIIIEAINDGVYGEGNYILQYHEENDGYFTIIKI